MHVGWSTTRSSAGAGRGCGNSRADGAFSPRTVASCGAAMMTNAYVRLWRVVCLLVALLGGGGPMPVAAFDLDDVDRLAAALARAPYRPAPSDEAAARRTAISYDAYRQLRFRPDHSLWRGQSAFEVQFFPLGRSFTRPLRMYEVVDDQAIPIVVPASAFDAPDAPPRTARECAGRRCRLAPDLPAAQRRQARRGDLGARRELLPRARHEPALRRLGTRPGRRHRRPARRGVPGLHRLLARASGSGRDGDDVLCAARRAERQRRLSFRAAPGQDDDRRRAGPPAPARSRRDAGHRAAHEHVPERREPARRGRLPPRGARLGRPADRAGRRRMALAPADATRGRPSSPRSPRRRRAASGWRSATAASRATRTWRRTTTAGRASGSSRSGTGARVGSSCCSSTRRTRRTTTSSPTGCPPACRRRARRSPWPGACTGRATTRRAPPGARVVQTRRGHGYREAPIGARSPAVPSRLRRPRPAAGASRRVARRARRRRGGDRATATCAGCARSPIRTPCAAAGA